MLISCICTDHEMTDGTQPSVPQLLQHLLLRLPHCTLLMAERLRLSLHHLCMQMRSFHAGYVVA